MKKINSIRFGAKVLAIGGIFAVVLPLLLYMLYFWVIKHDAVLILIKVSAAVGIAILVLFCLLLAIEFRQDKKINLQYNKVKYHKVQIAVGLYECQHCGSKEVKSDDPYCKACGVTFAKYM